MLDTSLSRYVNEYLLNIFSKCFRTLAEFGEGAQHTMEVGEVKQHGGVKEVCLSQLKIFMTCPQENFDVSHTQELCGQNVEITK